MIFSFLIFLLLAFCVILCSYHESEQKCEQKNDKQIFSSSSRRWLLKYTEKVQLNDSAEKLLQLSRTSFIDVFVDLLNYSLLLRTDKLSEITNVRFT